MVAGRQARVGCDDPGEPLRVFGDEPQPDQPAPVQANTFTGRLTEEMLDEVFLEASRIAADPGS